MSHNSYDPKRTYLVDTNTQNSNYLIRGNEPLLSDYKTFAYQEMNTKLKTLIGSNFNLANFSLIDISVIDNTPGSERHYLEAEFNCYGINNQTFNTNFPASIWPPYFNQLDVTKKYGTQVKGDGGNKHSGSIIWYPVQGCTDPSNCQQVEPTQFNFSGLVDYLNTLMTTSAHTIIYYHCLHGDDRTSALTAGYMMKYMKRNLNDVLTNHPPQGAKDFHHPWEPNYEALVKYYASTLP